MEAARLLAMVSGIVGAYSGSFGRGHMRATQAYRPPGDEKAAMSRAEERREKRRLKGLENDARREAGKKYVGPSVCYTVGHTKNYDATLEAYRLAVEANNPPSFPPLKVGRTFDYAGGWVWRTVEEARAFLASPKFLLVDWGDGLPRDPSKFSVYCVHLENGWEKDVIQGSGWSHLLRDSKFEAIV